MRALSASDVVYVWEAGRQKHPVDKALLLLALALPSLSPAALSSLTIGQRNIQLLLMRQSTLGSQASCFAQCPRCNEKLEFTIDLQALLPAEVTAPVEPAKAGASGSEELAERVHTLCVDAFNLSLRAPTSADLAAVVRCTDEREGRRLLIERCVVQATKDEQATAIESLPENILEALADAIVEHDPLVEMEFVLNCPACQHSWATLFDIVSFFWTELDALAKQLLRDVHTIASAYGWRESDILALSAARRQFYLELIR